MTATKRDKIKTFITDFSLALIGIISASIGLKALLLPNGFLDGGVVGVSLLLNQLTEFDISVLIVLINLPFIFMGYKHISHVFALKSLVTIAGLAIAVHFIEIPSLTDDKLLIAFFGGLFLGGGIGFAIRGGTVIDGTEILAIYLSKRFRISIGTSVLIFNVLLFGVAAILLNVEVALYSILTYVTASKSADYIIHGIEEYIGVTIISAKSDEVKHAITEDMGYGATVYRGKRNFKNEKRNDEDMDIIHTVVTRFEVRRLHSMINEIDSHAFVIEYTINDAKGGLIKKKKMH